MKSELKLCPFCGSKRIAITSSFGSMAICLDCWANTSKRNTSEEAIEAWKNHLSASRPPKSVNLMIAALNNFSAYFALSVRLTILKIPPPRSSLYYPKETELTKEEYHRLLRAAEAGGYERIALLMRTVCATGITVSDIERITVSALERQEMTVESRHMERHSSRKIEIPAKLSGELLEYARRQGIESGSIFVTRNGIPIERTNICAEMKRLCGAAGVERSKASPRIRCFATVSQSSFCPKIILLLNILYFCISW